uniref:Protein kinase domain-containing protein n=1 Tax=Oreochromis aureus TaxID=47969 RepID=A0AAZ1XZ05_OREAU
ICEMLAITDPFFHFPTPNPEKHFQLYGTKCPALKHSLNITYIYTHTAFLGEGGFGIVAKCRDTKTNQAVAIKVNKSRPDILQQAKLEIFILEQLRRLDPDAANIVQWNGFFHDGERVCLKFELLDQCLWDYIRDPNNRRLPISEVRPILGQLTNALSHLGSVGIVHADLKPGNIMVVNRHESPVKVRLIDFGLACPVSAVMPGDRVGTVGYSAPEVMLGLPYNEAIDMWSLGLVAVELATGVPLYPGNQYYDVLKFIIETQGQPPDHVLDSGAAKARREVIHDITLYHVILYYTTLYYITSYPLSH